MFDIQEELKKLPAKPGVYIMHDVHDDIIYVGKAIILKNRVRQYFQSSRNHTPKIRQMVSHVARFEYIITDSELEALVLEFNLIKEHRSIISRTDCELVYGPKYFALSFFMERTNIILGKASPTVTLIYG